MLQLIRNGLLKRPGVSHHSFRGTLQGVNLSLINEGINGGVDALLQVEAKYPVLLFKQQLTA
uniref:Uncharacterized protein n=1 Tax=Salix viminalis TaxID=40686 RepID=A0A6N2KZP5_SALVM